MTNILEQAAAAMRERFEAVDAVFRGETTLVIGSEHISEAAQVLRDEFTFDMLVDETAVDYWPELSPRFHVIYQLYSMSNNVLLRLRTPVDDNAPHVETLEKIYPNANWKEREIWDMFGIQFDGHSDLRRILMPEDWQGFPLRKDYPLGYEEVAFTFNKDEVDRRKPYAKE